MGTYTVSSLVHVDSFWGFFITTRVCEFRGILGYLRGDCTLLDYQNAHLSIFDRWRGLRGWSVW